jgi:hypothetical protein
MACVVMVVMSGVMVRMVVAVMAGMMPAVMATVVTAVMASAMVSATVATFTECRGSHAQDGQCCEARQCFLHRDPCAPMRRY